MTSKAPKSNPRGHNCSAVACHYCRRRKIKCSRELPSCSMCRRLSQACGYPQRILKPGPKLGSVRKNVNKRNRHDDSDFHDNLHQVSQVNNAAATHGDSGFQSQLAEEPVQTLPTLPGDSSSPTSLNHSKDMLSLSFIIHPSHETCSPEEDRGHQEELPQGQISEESLLTRASYTFGMTSASIKSHVENFFNTFTSFHLFRPAKFWFQLASVEKSSDIHALLASILIFGVKFEGIDYPNEQQCELIHDSLTDHISVDVAIKHVDYALFACGDELPSLALLQSLILLSHYLLISGVRGRAWRYLGNCVRIAYELNLHLIDARKSPSSGLSVPAKWAEDEEKRRAWWAIWEMDVFASTIRRCPTAINWQQNEVLLPAEDECWQEDRPQLSCFLESGIITRIKALQASRNQSPIAWFIVVNSLMKEAQTISSPMGINRTADGESSSADDVGLPASQERDVSLRLTTLSNAIRCFSMALPSRLKFQNQRLNFTTLPVTRDSASQSGVQRARDLHSAIYSIHLMTQLTILMAQKYTTFKQGLIERLFLKMKDKSDGHDVSETGDALRQYFDAAESVLNVILMSSEGHYRYVNPFLANTIWLACAVQLLKKELASSGAVEQEAAESNFEVLRMAYDQFVEFWGVPDTPKQNLLTLQGFLIHVREGLQKVSAEALADTSGRAKSLRQRQRDKPNGDPQRNTTTRADATYLDEDVPISSPREIPPTEGFTTRKCQLKHASQQVSSELTSEDLQSIQNQTQDDSILDLACPSSPSHLAYNEIPWMLPQQDDLNNVFQTTFDGIGNSFMGAENMDFSYFLGQMLSGRNDFL